MQQALLALGLLQASREVHGDPNLPWICARITKSHGDTRATGDQPTPFALCQFFRKVDADKDWFPGKYGGQMRGPKPVLVPARRQCIAVSAMAQKATGGEPSEPSGTKAGTKPIAMQIWDSYLS